MNRYLVLAVGLLLVVAAGALAQEGKQPPQPQPAPEPRQPPVAPPGPEKPKPDFSKSGSFGEPHAEPNDYVVTGNGIVQVNFPNPPSTPAVPKCQQEFRVSAYSSKSVPNTCEKAGSGDRQAVCMAAKSKVQKACDALCAQNPKCPYAALKRDEAGAWGCTANAKKNPLDSDSSTLDCSWTGVCECFSV